MKKKKSPVKVVVPLILAVAAAGVGYKVVNRYIPSKEVMDGNEYFGTSGGEDAAVVLPDRLEQGKALVKDGTAYVEYATAKENLNDHLYKSDEEQQVILTTAVDIIKLPYDSNEYTTLTGNGSMPYQIVVSQDGNVYIALDYLAQYTALQYSVEQEPLHIIINNQWGTKTFSDVIKEESVRLDADIKSPILKKEATGDKVTVLEQEEEWTKVLTADGYIGYMKSKKLSDSYEEQVTSDFRAAEYTSIHKDYDMNLLWHQVTSQDSNDALAADIQDVKGVNVISPTWFSISSNDGDISSLASSDYVDTAHQNDMEVWGLMDNFSTDIDTDTVLGTTTSRENLEGQLITEALNYQLDGINIDIESLPEETSESYVQFMRELSVKCRNNNLVLSVDVPSPYSFNEHYSQKELGEVVDYVIIMGYDEHYAGSTDAGSVSSLGFVKAGIEDTLKEVPAQKVINAIPFYTRVWIQPFGAGNLTSEVLGMDGAANYISEHGMDTYWDDEAGQNVASVEAEDGIYTIWVEDEQSIGEKMKLIQENQLAGVAEWKLGFERASVWPVIAQYLQ